jgi:hypothetical protein
MAAWGQADSQRLHGNSSEHSITATGPFSALPFEGTPGRERSSVLVKIPVSLKPLLIIESDQPCRIFPNQEVNLLQGYAAFHHRLHENAHTIDGVRVEKLPEVRPEGAAMGSHLFDITGNLLRLSLAALSLKIDGHSTVRLRFFKIPRSVVKTID